MQQEIENPKNNNDYKPTEIKRYDAHNIKTDTTHVRKRKRH